MVKIAEALLDQKLAELEQARSWSPRLVSKLEALLRTDDEQALFRISPLTFAAERGAQPHEATDLFLHATKLGLTQMDWNVLCPCCGMALESFGTLRALRAHCFCGFCAIETHAQLDDYIQVAFTVDQRIRAIRFHDPDNLSAEDYLFQYLTSPLARLPDGQRFVEAMRDSTRVLCWLAPGQSITKELELGPGMLAGADLRGAQGSVRIAIDAAAKDAPRHITLVVAGDKVTPSSEVVQPGPVTIEIANQSGRRVPLMLCQMGPEMLEHAGGALTYGPFLTGSMLLTNQTFRRLFRSEVIDGQEGIGVRDVTLLFTDLKGSTALYERIGDLRAFALVRQHFDRLAHVVQQHEGAVVKTIGDAVMAAFREPHQGLQAARTMFTEIERFNDEHGRREIILKIGIHRGASIAVTLNDNLDYFGQTVNIAARVQGLAEADEICLTQEVLDAPGVTDMLATLPVVAIDAQLKGIQKQVRVYRLRS